jgi:hypothetical protein
MRMTGLVPMLQTDDMARTRNWYEEVARGLICRAVRHELRSVSARVAR